jgi:Tol biopolymer transport system component
MIPYSVNPLLRMSYFTGLAVMSLVSTFPGLGAEDLKVITVSDPSFPKGISGSSDSYTAGISADGRFVLMTSVAENLVMGQSNRPLAHAPVTPLNLYLRDRSSNSTALVSMNLEGTAGSKAGAYSGQISTNGVFVVFASEGDDLVANDTNLVSDVFVRDMSAGVTRLVSRALDGGAANGASYSEAMTPDGRYVVFVSEASNLVANDTNRIPDVFVRDMRDEVTSLVSVNARSSGTADVPAGSSESPQITPDGRFVAFYSTATNLVPGVPTVSGTTRYGDIYVRDMLTQVTTWASQGARGALGAMTGASQGNSFNHRISDDGQFVAYEAAESGNAVGVVLRFNRSSGVTEVIHTQALVESFQYELASDLAMTGDGQRIVFVAETNAPVEGTPCVLMWDAATSRTELVSATPDGEPGDAWSCSEPQIDVSGRFVAFFSDAPDLVTNVVNGDVNLYLRDLQANVTWLVNQDAGGDGTVYSPVSAAMSDDGRYLAFDLLDDFYPGDRNDAYDVFARAIPDGELELISRAHPDLFSITAAGMSTLSMRPSGGDGRLLVFASDAEDLVPNDDNGSDDIFLHDLVTGTNRLITVALGEGDLGFASDAQISVDGQFVVFASSLGSLVSDDTNLVSDIFLADVTAGMTTLVSVTTNGTMSGNGTSSSPLFSASGSQVAFLSTARNLATNPVTFSFSNLHLRDLKSGITRALTTQGGVGSYSMSDDGRFVAYVGGTGPTLYVWDTQLGRGVYTNRPLSLGAAAISPNGQRLAYWSTLTGARGLTCEELTAKTNEVVVSLASVTGNTELVFSDDGSWLAFTLNKQLFLHDCANATNLLVSRGYLGGEGNGVSDTVTFSPGGRYLAFVSNASDLVPGDTNELPDVFLYDRIGGALALVSASRFGGSSADSASLAPRFGVDARRLFFVSWASDLVANDYNSKSDVFMLELEGSAPVTPVKVSARGEGDVLWLAWSGTMGQVYRVEYTDSLENASWQTAPCPVTMVGDQAQCQVPVELAGSRFYRVVAY